VLAPDELDSLEDRIHIFVFARGQCLAKEGETVDYVGVIAEGRAVGKGVPF
jgi:CRP-like cAMP-binding protein